MNYYERIAIFARAVRFAEEDFVIRIFFSKENAFISLVSALALIFGASSCTLSSPKQNTLHIAFPKLRSSAITMSGTSFPTPTALSDFTCFGINVTGSGISADGRLSCTGGISNPGILGGFASISGGEIDVTVPSGAARQVEIFAVQSTVGCGDLNAILSSPVPRFTGIGQPYRVGVVTADVFEDTTVNVQVGFNATTSPLLFAQCSDGPGTGLPTIVSGGPQPPIQVLPAGGVAAATGIKANVSIGFQNGIASGSGIKLVIE